MIRQVFWDLLYTEEDSSPTLFTKYLHIKCVSSPSHLSVWAELLFSSQQTRTQCLKMTGYKCICKLWARTKTITRNKFDQRWHQFVLPLPKWDPPWCFYSLFGSGMVEDWILRSKDSHAKACDWTVAWVIWTRRGKRSRSLPWRKRDFLKLWYCL